MSHVISTQTALFVGYRSGSAFLAVYHTAIDAVFLCYCEDLRLHDGSPERPYCVDEAVHRAVVAASSVTTATDVSRFHGG